MCEIAKKKGIAELKALTTDETDNAIMHLIRKTQTEFGHNDRFEGGREREREGESKSSKGHQRFVLVHW